jgi:hypothetical protein
MKTTKLKKTLRKVHGVAYRDVDYRPYRRKYPTGVPGLLFDLLLIIATGVLGTLYFLY